MKVKDIVGFILLGSLLLIDIFPVYFMFVTALTPPNLVFFPSLLPRGLSLSNFLETMFEERTGFMGKDVFWTQLTNSIFYALAVTILTLFIASLGGYSLAKLNSPGRQITNNLVIFSYVMPWSFLIVPIYALMHSYNLLDTPQGIILVETASAIPYCIYVFREHFLSIPRELEECALVDGASRTTIFLKIMIPLSGPTIVALSIFAFLLSWNEYLIVLALAIDRVRFTLPIGIYSAFGSDVVPWGALMATGILCAIPPLIFYYSLQKYMVRGILAGAVKA